MSADLLRRASRQIRTDKEREENLGHIDGRDFATWMRVADWLDRVAGDADDGIFDQHSDALPVARAYLGESA